jgi:IS5 family transposase
MGLGNGPQSLKEWASLFKWNGRNTGMTNNKTVLRASIIHTSSGFSWTLTWYPSKRRQTLEARGFRNARAAYKGLMKQMGKI